MIDSINQQNWHGVLEKFREYAVNSYSAESSTTAFSLKITSDFEEFLNECDLPLEEALKKYYFLIIGKPAFLKPEKKQGERKARVLRGIWDICNGNIPRTKYTYDSVSCPECFQDEFVQYETLMKSDQKSNGTIYTRCGRIKVFFIYLSSNKCTSIGSITPELLCSFVADLSEKYSAQGKASILYTLRNFFSYQVFLQAASFDPFMLLYSLHSMKHERLPSVYRADEIRAVMAAVDRSTSWGKTIYLMMLLACVYGMRSSDIKELCLDAVNWKNRTIVLSQYKTKQSVSLPLTDELMYALLDYLKNVRPSTDFPQVFIRIRKPHIPYSMNDHFGDKVSVYFKKAGIDTQGKHHGLHSLRHSLATNLSAHGVPANEIANVLGHSSTASTKAYIWSDIEHLRSAAMEVPSYDQ